jgi:hypothetical protein
MVPLATPLFGVIFLPIAPYLDAIQALSSTRAFLLVKKKQRLLCMGRTSTVISPTLYNIALNLFCGSWESNPARVKASKNFNI